MLRATRNSPSPGPTRFPHTSQELETRSDELWPNRGFFIAGLMIVFMAIMNVQNTLASLAGVLVVCGAWNGFQLWTPCAALGGLDYTHD